jgi:hypothetical protein
MDAFGKKNLPAISLNRQCTEAMKGIERGKFLPKAVQKEHGTTREMLEASFLCSNIWK